MEEIKIAIQGNSKRGEQVIKELEKLGGQNSRVLSGTLESFYYYIGAKSFICCNTKEWIKDYFQCNNETCFYTLAEYKRMKRRAKIKSFINKKHE
jgi:hypothetical protein